jgi:hypothetical protein
MGCNRKKEITRTTSKENLKTYIIFRGQNNE